MFFNDIKFIIFDIYYKIDLKVTSSIYSKQLIMSSTSASYQKFLKNFYKFVEDYNKEVREKVENTLPNLSDDDKQKLEELFSTLITKADLCSTKAAPKKKRAPTAYNLFMKDMITDLRKKHPTIDKKDLMSMGAKEWQKQKAQQAKTQATSKGKK